MNKTATELIKAHEGLRHFAYKCPAGKSTIGYGRNIDVAGGKGLSMVECEYLLNNDTVAIIGRLQKQVPVYGFLNEARQAVLISMVYNLGMNGFLKFKNMLKAIHDLDFDKASREMLDSKWALQVGNRVDDLAEIMVLGRIK